MSARQSRLPQPTPPAPGPGLGWELSSTMGLGMVGSAGLFSILGGTPLLGRGQGPTTLPGIGLGGAVTAVILLLFTHWGVRTATRALGRLPSQILEIPAPAHRHLQRLPYCLAAGFLLAGISGGALAAARLTSLRSDDRVLAAILWGFCCGISALALLLRLRSVLARRIQALQVRLADPVGRLLPLSSKLLGGFGWLLLCVTALSLLKHILLGPGEGRLESLPMRGLVVALLAQVVAAGGVVALCMVALAWPVRDLLRRALAVVGESRGSRGELQRPIVLGVFATAELHELQGLFEQLRRRLLSRLRSSTEQNLQLESEVARRSAELSRRNEELSDALLRLQSAREELVSAEKLATVGRIAAGITSEVDLPVARMSARCQSLTATTNVLLASIGTPASSTDDARKEALVAAAVTNLEALNAAAMRVRDIVRAMRVYVRPGETQAASCDVLAVLADVRQLFGEPFQRAMTVPTAGSATGCGSHVVTVRSDLALLLASWLARVEARLGDGPRVVASTRLVDLPDSRKACELTLSDNGQPLSWAELAEPIGGELLRRLGATVALRSAPAAGGVGDETVLSLTLPVAP